VSPSPPTSNEKCGLAKSSRNEHEGRVELQVEGSARSGSGGRRMAMLRLHTSTAPKDRVLLGSQGICCTAVP
jgi:hypothetical protein